MNVFPHIGKIVTEYEFYDLPLLFSCVDETGQHFIGLLTERNDDGETWIYSPITTDDLTRLDTGAVTFHEALRGACGPVVVIRDPYKGTEERRTVDAAEIPSEWLPLEGEYA